MVFNSQTLESLTFAASTHRQRARDKVFSSKHATTEPDPRIRTIHISRGPPQASANLQRSSFMLRSGVRPTADISGWLSIVSHQHFSPPAAVPTTPEIECVCDVLRREGIIPRYRDGRGFSAICIVSIATLLRYGAPTSSVRRCSRELVETSPVLCWSVAVRLLAPDNAIKQGAHLHPAENNQEDARLRNRNSE